MVRCYLIERVQAQKQRCCRLRWFALVIFAVLLLEDISLSKMQSTSRPSRLPVDARRGSRHLHSRTTVVPVELYRNAASMTIASPTICLFLQQCVDHDEPSLLGYMRD